MARVDLTVRMKLRLVFRFAGTWLLGNVIRQLFKQAEREAAPRELSKATCRDGALTWHSPLLFHAGLEEFDMPTRELIWKVADQLRDEQVRVSLRSLRAALPRGGSFADIGPHLAAWKADRQYKPRIELAQLPEFLQTDISKFGHAIWAAAMARQPGSSTPIEIGWRTCSRLNEGCERKR